MNKSERLSFQEGNHPIVSVFWIFIRQFNQKGNIILQKSLWILFESGCGGDGENEIETSKSKKKSYTQQRQMHSAHKSRKNVGSKFFCCSCCVDNTFGWKGGITWHNGTQGELSNLKRCITTIKTSQCIDVRKWREHNTHTNTRMTYAVGVEWRNRIYIESTQGKIKITHNQIMFILIETTTTTKKSCRVRILVCPQRHAFTYGYWIALRSWHRIRLSKSICKLQNVLSAQRNSVSIHHWMEFSWYIFDSLQGVSLCAIFCRDLFLEIFLRARLSSLKG